MDSQTKSDMIKMRIRFEFPRNPNAETSSDYPLFINGEMYNADSLKNMQEIISSAPIIILLGYN